MFRLSIISLLLLSWCSFAADISYTDDGADHLWSNTANWNGGAFPNDSATGAACNNDGTVLQITNGIDAVCKGFMLGQYGKTNSAEISGGTLTCVWLDVGRVNDKGGNGTLEVTGGNTTVSGDLQVPNQFSSMVDPAKMGVGHVDLLGGTLSCARFHMGTRQIGDRGGIGTMEVTLGTLIVDGDEAAKIQGYIDNGWITAFGGDGYFQLDYNVRNAGKTTLTAGNDAQASNPNPAHEAEGISINPVLSWTAGVAAESHDVYFGATNPPAFIDNQALAETTYSPGPLTFNTTYYWRINEVQGSEVFAGPFWSFTTGSPPLAAQDPDPADGLTGLKPNTKLRWTPSVDADSHDVYFGTTDPPPFISNEDKAFYDPGNLDPNTTYYWRVDEKNIHGTTAGPVWDFTVSPLPFGDLNEDWFVSLSDFQILASRWLDLGCGIPNDWCGGADLSKSSNVDLVDYALWAPEYSNIQPPYTDYCDMLSQEIQGKKHGFMAGNKTYYIGGRVGWDQPWPSWFENETLGFTHPFYHDLRSRGTGMVYEESTGYGHDLQGNSWHFYRYAKVAHGTVIVGGTEYADPVPTAMYWQPDKMICEYSVGGVNIREEKFIAENDAACTIITSDVPVTLKFNGQSFWSTDNSVTSTATCTFDGAENLIRIAEGGTVIVKPCDACPQQEGVMVYDGMTTVLSSDRPMTNYSATSDGNNQWFYEFKVSCDSSGVSIIWAMDYDQSNAITLAQEVVSNPAGQMQAKTDHMNDILNYQIPYFRCSDQEIVDIYYYLWAINLMYYIDVDQGFEQYPHTQTAVNNFLGMHRYDADFQIQAGAWAADKEQYANGNVLIWSELLPFADLEKGLIPADNMGIAWYSGFWGSVTAHVEGAWKIYEHSGDLGFLQKAYDFYKGLMWQKIPGKWGYEYTAADCLAKMAYKLGYPEDMQHWYDLVNMDNIDNWLNSRWETDTPHWFGGGNPMDWSNMALMAMDAFPDDWAWEMTEYWATDEVDGFFHFGHISTKAYKDWDLVSDVFAFTPDTNWFAIRGMYKHHVGSNANKCTLGHLKNYNLEWGIPVAPESLKINGDPTHDQYSNFNAGKILLIIEGILGLEYSVVDESFTVADHLPAEWDYMETYVPIHENGQTQWTKVRVSRVENASNFEKTISVEGNSQSTLNIQPWLEEKNLLSAPGGYTPQEPKGHIGYQFDNIKEKTIQIILEK